jgi:hypothetical protein
LSWGERWFLLILVELLTITQCIEVRGYFCWYWWNCWPSLNELKWEVMFVDIGGIVDPPISIKITSHLNSLSEGQQFHQYQQQSPLTSTHWVMVNNSTNINKNHLSLQLIQWWSRGDFCWYWWDYWPSFNELRWEVIFVDIGGIVDHHSMSWSEMIIPPISTKITSHLNSLSDGQQFHQYQQKSPLTSTHWVTVNNSTNINKNHLSPKLIEWWSTIDHHSMSLGERWFLLILVELLTIIQWLKMRGDCCWYWWNCWHHSNQQKSPLTSTHWVMVNNITVTLSCYNICIETKESLASVLGVHQL